MLKNNNNIQNSIILYLLVLPMHTNMQVLK